MRQNFSKVLLCSACESSSSALLCSRWCSSSACEWELLAFHQRKFYNSNKTSFEQRWVKGWARRYSSWVYLIAACCGAEKDSGAISVAFVDVDPSHFCVCACKLSLAYRRVIAFFLEDGNLFESRDVSIQYHQVAPQLPGILHTWHIQSPRLQLLRRFMFLPMSFDPSLYFVRIDPKTVWKAPHIQSSAC